MAKLATDSARTIIEDFARLIKEKRIKPRKPDEWVINFRNEQKDGKQREVFLVPIDILRFRKDNGRITSDVLSYERLHGILNERSKETQKLLAGFLERKDPERTEDLLRSVQHDGQREPAIITCDGFLINGNRRKLVLEKLSISNSDFKFMRVVILPGIGEEGGPPTLQEIELIENRYQLQSDGKAEYYGFDRALSIRRKMELGISLEDQLRDDPLYATLPLKDFEDAVKKYELEFLKPLECVDRYLEDFGREGLYDTVSSGSTDKEGRWQSFIDYSKFYEQLKNDKKRSRLGIEEDEIGIIENIAFKLIRKRVVSSSQSGSATGLPKVHKIMRDLPKLLRSESSGRKELLKLRNIETDLSPKEKSDKAGVEYAPRDLDKVWGEKHSTDFIRQLKRAYQLIEHDKDMKGAINSLRAALEKLNNDDLQDPSSVGVDDIDEAAQLARDIRDRAHELETTFYRYKKNLKKLADGGK